MDNSLPLHQLQPDELVAGYIGRLGLRLGLEWRGSDLRYRLYHRIRELGHDVENDLFSIVEIFSGVNRHELLEFHSWAPFSNAICHYRGDETYANAPQSGANFAREVLGLFNIPNACPLCIKEDLKELGFTYWHRVHQIPGAFYCTHHDTRLVLIQERFPYYRQPHHFINGPVQSDQLNSETRAFHLRMREIWIGILSSRKPLGIRKVMDLLRHIYSADWSQMWDIALKRLAASSTQYSLELSAFEKELGGARKTPHDARLLVAALAATSIKVKHLVNFINDPDSDTIRFLQSHTTTQTNFTSKVSR